MSVDTKIISNEQAIPVIGETNIFRDKPDARFALGVIASSAASSLDEQELFRAYLQLRANVYIDQAELLDESYRRADGTEADSDDDRSTHIVALENRSTHVGVVGSMRVIKKSDSNALPFEEYFGHVPIGGVEISRYINRLDDRKKASEVQAGLFASALAIINLSYSSPTVAIVEPLLEDRLRRRGVPVKRIADPKLLEKYKDTNVGIEIDTIAFADQFGGVDALRAVPIEPGVFTYWGEVEARDA